jgi:hypothetical protein
MGDEDHPTPKDLQAWLTQETVELAKALELRLRDAQDFVTRYSAGELTAKQAMERFDRYVERWGDSPIPGVSMSEEMTNAEVLARLDSRTQQVSESSPSWRSKTAGSNLSKRRK